MSYYAGYYAKGALQNRVVFAKRGFSGFPRPNYSSLG